MGISRMFMSAWYPAVESIRQAITRPRPVSATAKPAILIRNQKKDYGTAKQLEGAIHEGERVVLLEDIATTGGQVLEAGQLLRDTFKVNVPAIIATIDRQEGARENIEAAGFAFDALFTKSDLGIDE